VNSYPVGSVIQVKSADSSAVGFLNMSSGSGVLADPNVISLYVTINEGPPIIFSATMTGIPTTPVLGGTTVTTGTWPLQSTFPVTITRSSIGLFSANLATSNGVVGTGAITLPGEWIYEWQGSGAVVAVKPNIFYVTTFPN